MTIKVGDKVVMKGSVIKRARHSEFSRNFQGVVKAVIGNTADIETVDGVRCVPINNLCKKKMTGFILDTST